MDTIILVVVIAAVLLAILRIAIAVTAALGKGWLTNRRRAAASDARDEAAEIDRTARTHDAQADEMAAREEAAHRLRDDAHVEGETAAERERRADEIDPEIDERSREDGGTERPRGW